MSAQPDVAANLIGRLKRAVEEKDRRLLAIARRSLASPPGQDLRAVMELEGSLYGLPLSKRRYAHCYLIAGLFALHPVRLDDGSNLGASLAALANDKPNSRDSLRRRLAALVDADDEQLPVRLRQCIQLLAQAGFGVDFYVLLKNLFSWNSATRHVQRRWLKSFLDEPHGLPDAAVVSAPSSTTNA